VSLWSFGKAPERKSGDLCSRSRVPSLVVCSESQSSVHVTGVFHTILLNLFLHDLLQRRSVSVAICRSDIVACARQYSPPQGTGMHAQFVYSEIDHEANNGLRHRKHGKELMTCENMTRTKNINGTTSPLVYRATK
jgi:hypothetical protein